MLAAHGEALMGAEGKHTKARAAGGEKMLAIREEWNNLETPAKLKWLRHLSVTGSQAQTLLQPRITSWNVGPHGFENSRDEIFNLFAQGDPVICLQDLHIPRKKVADVKLEIQTLFPQYWVFVATLYFNGRGFQDSDGKHYHFTTLTALDSHFFPPATNLTLRPGTSKGPKNKRQPISAGRLLAMTTKTKDGGRFNIINLYQFTADKVDDRERV